MRFALIDQITDLQPGVSLTAVKALSMSEEYLQDHFPRFPVMPGVLMLETIFQASMWLVYQMDDFRHSTILLKEARCVRYADFVRPGETLTVRADLVKNEGNLTTIKAQGWVRDVAAVSGKLVVERFNVADRDPARIAWDGYARREMRKRFALLYEPEKAE